MRLGEIDLNLKANKASMFLCKPNRTVIHPLKDIYNARFSIKMGKVNELNFVIPTMIERNHELIENPLINKIKHRYLVKMEYNNQTEYLVFLEENKSYQNNGEEISYRLYGEGFLLADKTIRGYEATSQLLSTILGDVLEYTNWRVGYVDSYFDATYRSHEISSQTVLQAVYELAEKFNAIIVWDTVNLEINLYNPSNLGMNKGLRFKQGKYLESFNVTTNSEEIVTRLKIYGNEGLTIRKLTPTGANYIEDFSYFMYPFERDAEGNVIKSSDYMSDELCIALEDYAEVLANAQGSFETYTTNLGLKQDELQQSEQELSVLQTELIQIMDEIDVLNAAGDAGTPQHTTAIQNRAIKEADIASKIGVIAGIDSEIETLNADWESLRATLVIEANLSPAELLELNKFIIEKEHTNDTIIDEEDLLEEAINVFNEFREPKVGLNMSIVNFLSVVEAQNDWNKLYIGDIVTTQSERLNVNIQAKIIEIEFDFESYGINLVIANEKELKDADAKWLEQLYGAEQTSTTVSMDKYKWDLIEETNGVVSQMLNNAWSTIERNITAGMEQDITISKRGIIIKSPDDPMSWLVIQNGQLAITNDAGNTWKQAISKNGIYGERIIGRLIMGEKLIIEDEDGIMRLTGSLQEIFNDLGEPQVMLGEYETGKYGLKIVNGAVDIRTSTTSNRGVTFDKDGLRAYNNSGGQTFNIDSNGNATFSGTIYASNGYFSGDITGSTGTFSGTLSGGLITGSAFYSTAYDSAFSATRTMTLNEGQLKIDLSNGQREVSVSPSAFYIRGNSTSSYASLTPSQLLINSGTQSLSLSYDSIYSSGILQFFGNISFANATVTNWGTNSPVAKFG